MRYAKLTLLETFKLTTPKGLVNTLHTSPTQILGRAPSGESRTMSTSRPPKIAARSKRTFCGAPGAKLALFLPAKLLLVMRFISKFTSTKSSVQIASSTSAPCSTRITAARHHGAIDLVVHGLIDRARPRQSTPKIGESDGYRYARQALSLWRDTDLLNPPKVRESEDVP